MTLGRRIAIQLAVFAAVLSLSSCQREVRGTAVARDGTQLAYFVMGRGEDTVIVLPGVTGFSHQYLAEALRALSRRHVLVFYDGRARGASSGEIDDVTLESELEDLDAVRRHLALGRSSLIGHHDGAFAAVAFALRHPAEVRQLVLIGPSAPSSAYAYSLAQASMDSVTMRRYAEADHTAWRRRDPGGYCEAFWPYLLAPSGPAAVAVRQELAPVVCQGLALNPDAVSALKVSLHRSISGGNAKWSWLDSLPSQRVRTLVVFGQSDTAHTHLSNAWAWHSADGRSVGIPGAAPQFPWVGHRRAFHSHLADFLLGEWPVGALRLPPDSVR